jgi:hypothetical protein
MGPAARIEPGPKSFWALNWLQNQDFGQSITKARVSKKSPLRDKLLRWSSWLKITTLLKTGRSYLLNIFPKAVAWNSNTHKQFKQTLKTIKITGN